MTTNTNDKIDFGGLEVVAFESRLAKEMATLIERRGGVPRVAPSMREVPLADNPAAFAFAAQLFADRFDAVIFLTGVGTRTLFAVLETRFAREEIVRALSKIAVVARGPKPVKVLREYQIPIAVLVPEPNTWREILQELDKNPAGFRWQGSKVALQEYGISNRALIAELKTRGADVTPVPVYRWQLPEDVRPLEQAIESIVAGRARVALFTSAAQADHVLQVAARNGLKERLLESLAACAVCSIGPKCSESLREHGIQVDLESEHGKMGVLVHVAAQRAAELLKTKIENRKSKIEIRNSKTCAEPAAAGDRIQNRRSTVGYEKSAISHRPSAIENLQSPIANHQSQILSASRFLQACRLEPVDTTPVWLMRQAGRYMKEYRELRAKIPFLEMCKNPELAAEITVTAAQKIGADAAIIFSDLLVIAEPLGFAVEYEKGEGPVITPALRQASDVDRLGEVDPAQSLGYVFEAIRRARAKLPAALPLIGFAAAPFTLASYLIEGGASRNFRLTKTLMYRDSGAWRTLMEHLARNLARYVNGQIAAGIQAVQIFDTWFGCLGPADYREFAMPYTRLLISDIAKGVPVIHFGTGTAAFLEDMGGAGGNIIGLDSHVELDRAWNRLGERVGVQGNLDPTVLFAELPYIRERVQRILRQAAGRPGHIFNLGHGVLPDTPFQNVAALVEMVHELGAKRL